VSEVQPPPTTDASLGELFSHLSEDLSGLMHDELELAKVELKEEIGNVGRAGSMFGAAALAGYMTIVLLSFAAAWGLAELMAVGWAFLIIAALWGAAGALLYVRGRDQFQKVNLKPEQTITTLKEDVQWAKNQKP
jgi:uncharacterized membrane protein YqjE